MKLIVGLGNPDDKYKNTFHNLGFTSVEKSASLFGADFTTTKFRALIATKTVAGEKVIFAKPLTYMNLSGESVREIVNYFKVDVKDLIVIYDDVDIDAGTIRIREKGSAGTHNGMRNVIKELGTDNFARIRVGFKTERAKQIPLIDYVLSGIRPEEKDLFDKATSVAGKAGFDFASGKPLQEIMQRYNGGVENK